MINTKKKNKAKKIKCTPVSAAILNNTSRTDLTVILFNKRIKIKEVNHPGYLRKVLQTAK